MKPVLKKYFADEIIDRMVRVDYNYSKADVEEWCEENNVYARYTGKFLLDDLWIVPNDEQRLMFVLRWK